MRPITRRRFLAGSAAAGAATFLTPCSRVRGANNDLRVAVIGHRGKGGQHIKVVTGMEGVRLVAVCDADQVVVDKAVSSLKKKKIDVDGYQDMRKIFDRTDIDAIITATPNHWHALTAIWAMQSGKDVYVEKPVSHNVFEGRKMVEAARKYKRICQGGMQNRSDVGLRPFYQWMNEGNLGKIKMVRGLCYRNRTGIGARLSQPLTPPAAMDYDLWLGPADDVPIYRPRLHYDWHWVWNTGNGDIGNQGPHELDMCSWAMGDKTLPKSVMSFGGRFGWKDAGETCNMQVAMFDYGDVPVIFEVRDMWTAPDKKSSPDFKGTRVGAIITCEGGEFRGGRGGGWVYDNKGEKLKQFKGDGGGKHQQNFFDAVRSRKVEDVHCEIENAHRSSALAHLANASVRVGQDASPGQLREQVKGDKLLTDAMQRFSEQLAAWKIDFTKEPWAMGPTLQIDPKTERFCGGTGYEKANTYLTRNYRKPFIVPDKV